MCANIDTHIHTHTAEMEKSKIFWTPHTWWDRQDAVVDTISLWWIWAGEKRPPSGQLMAKQFVCLCLDAFMCSIKWSLHSGNGTSPQTHLQPWEEMRQEVRNGWDGHLLKKGYISLNLHIDLILCTAECVWWCVYFLWFVSFLALFLLWFNFCSAMQINIFTVCLGLHPVSPTLMSLSEIS